MAMSFALSKMDKEERKNDLFCLQGQGPLDLALPSSVLVADSSSFLQGMRTPPTYSLKGPLLLLLLEIRGSILPCTLCI